MYEVLNFIEMLSNSKIEIQYNDVEVVELMATEEY